jgi:putative transposase
VDLLDPFIEAEKTGRRSANRACAVMKVSRAAYYEWRRQKPYGRAQEDQELTEKVRAIFDSSRQTTGRHESTGTSVRTGCARARRD